MTKHWLTRWQRCVLRLANWTGPKGSAYWVWHHPVNVSDRPWWRLLRWLVGWNT